jgi:D-alanine--poly(phosphoribitol) ligase subunit 2
MTGTDSAIAVGGRALGILREVTGDGEVLADLDVPLYASGLLDSFATVTLIAAFEDAFGLTISPAEFDRAAWSTPRALVADLERRVADAQRLR